MIDGILDGCLETFGPWLFGGVFSLAALFVFTSLAWTDNRLFTAVLGLLLLHTAVLLIVGMGLKKATRSLAISWIVFLICFVFGSAILFA